MSGRTRCVLAAGFPLMFLLSGCQASDGDRAAPVLEVREARVQLLPQVGAAYFEVVNKGGPDRLLRVESPQAEDIQMHESIEDNGVVSMREATAGFPVPASGKLVLAPGGKHLMLFGVAADDQRSTLPLTLYFERHAAIDVQAIVVGPAALH